MDVLKPPTISIKGRCYRKLPFEHYSGQEHQQDSSSIEEAVNWEDESCEDGVLVKQTTHGFTTAVPVPSALFKFVIGRRGETKKKIEKETSTQIQIPKMGQEGDITITGPQKAGVMSARNRVDLIVESSRWKLLFTHFVAFPLYNDDIIPRLQEFKSQVLQECGKCRGVDGSIFQNPAKMHLTVGMLVLLNNTEIRNAASYLEKCSQELIRDVLGDKPVAVKLQGVEYMNDDPSEVDVLYARVIPADGSDSLQRLADGLENKFKERGLMRYNFEHVKLHATVMNTKLRDDPEGTDCSEAKKSRSEVPARKPFRIPFDARQLVKKFKDYDFGEFHLESIHLSQRGNFEANGQYYCASSVPLP